MSAGASGHRGDEAVDQIRAQGAEASRRSGFYPSLASGYLERPGGSTQATRTMSDIEIVRVSILPFGMVNAHIIVGERGCVVVDAGLPGSERKIARTLKAKGLTLRDVRLIVVTHAHIDHAGGALALRELSGAPIMGHREDTR